MASVRIVCMDYYLSPPISGLDPQNSAFRGSSISKLPVIRIFGSDEDGRKVCLHVHGVFPYIYVPFEGKEDPKGVAYQLASGLDKALNVSQGQASSSQQHVYDVGLVHTIPFYGYHARQHPFFKISFYNPQQAKRACALLQNGSVLGRSHQPHEAHIPYHQQFMIDHNLHGMNLVKLRRVYPRTDAKVKRVSVCALEMDARAEDILNTAEIGEVNPGIEHICAEERARRRDAGEDEPQSQFLTSERALTVDAAASSEKYKILLLSKLEDNSSTQSQDSLLDVTCLDNTVIEEDANFLMSMLRDNEGVEEDSVLSQRPKTDEGDDEEQDLTIPLVSVTTPIKMVLGEDAVDGEDVDAFFISPEDETIGQLHQSVEVEKPRVDQLDGQNGSSSSDDEEVVVVRKKRRMGKAKTASPYPALQVEIRSPARAGSGEHKHGPVTRRQPPRRATRGRGNANAAVPKPPTQTTANVEAGNAAKRKLTFQRLDATVVQESVSCWYSPTRNKRLAAGAIDNPTACITDNRDSVTDMRKSDARGLTVLRKEAVAGVNEDKPDMGRNYTTVFSHGNEGGEVTDVGNDGSNVTDKEVTSVIDIGKEVGKAGGVVTDIGKIDSDVTNTVEAVQDVINLIGKEGGEDITEEGSDVIHSDDSTDIFTPETSREIQRPPADKYDAAVHYVPVAGPSRDARIVLSGNTSSSSGLLTPYQEEMKTGRTHGASSISLFPGNLSIISEGDALKNADSRNNTLLASLNVNELIAGDLISAEGHCVLVPKYNPPSVELVSSTMAELGVPQVRNEDPFYSDPSDCTGSVEVGHSVLKIKSKTTVNLDDFDSDYRGFATLRLGKVYGGEEDVVRMVPAKKPPGRREVEAWVKARAIRSGEVQAPVKKRERVRLPQDEGDTSGDDLSLTLSPCTPVEVRVEGVTGQPSQFELSQKISSSGPTQNSNCADPDDSTVQRLLADSRMFREISPNPQGSHQISATSLNNTHGFKFSLGNYHEVKSNVVRQHLTTLVIELHVPTRGALLPDPELDAVTAIFHATLDDGLEGVATGIIAVGEGVLEGTGYTGVVDYVSSEVELYAKFLELVRKCDPDVLLGYEVERASWGYLVERGYKLGMNYAVELSRVPGETPWKRDGDEGAELRIIGRVILDLWRLLRHELALNSYGFENVVYHVLHERAPLFSAQDLTNWWLHKCGKFRARTIDFYVYRVKTALRIVDHFDLLGRTSELARLFGILFYEVLSRGSQFRVESMMLRLAKPANYVAVSPSVQQRARMRAPEHLPLILEPESKFYKDPVIVLDFQSLYPSMIIAYNYCFSTCLGRCERLGTSSPFEFGAATLRQSRARLRKLLEDDLVHFSPCGVGYVKPAVRDGILPRMLREILDTRLLVKDAMKRTRSNRTLQRVLHSRQLGLKLIANVTYGYTAANFSGRMPAVEIADSVVSKGRETLQRAIKLVERNAEWKARVVYGDTDSLFVLVAGRSRTEAFRVGEEIAEAVTRSNPSPVRLKLEKVYQPCILQTKKRYVGYLYESADQQTPDFDAKGIETVRRDGCPAVAKMLEKCLRMLFETRDVSAIKRYVQRQFHKLLSGRVSIQDLTFAKEYRGAAGYKPGACVPALELAKKWKSVDRRKEPRRSERVPYVIINGPPGLPLIRMVRSPHDLLVDPSLKPNAFYYITKVIIPPLNRCFLLIGADVNAWFNEMPRRRVQYLPTSSPSKSKKSTISQYFATTSCAGCSKQTRDGLCTDCARDPQSASVILHEKVREWERCYHQTYKICQSCCGRMSELPCVSLDCPVLYRLVQTERDAQQVQFVRDLVERRLPLDF